MKLYLEHSESLHFASSVFDIWGHKNQIGHVRFPEVGSVLWPSLHEEDETWANVEWQQSELNFVDVKYDRVALPVSFSITWKVRMYLSQTSLVISVYSPYSNAELKQKPVSLTRQKLPGWVYVFYISAIKYFHHSEFKEFLIYLVTKSQICNQL